MSIRLEFYGIPRQRAGVESIEVDARSLGEALERAAAELPRFAGACLDGNRLRTGYLANVNGRRFTTDPATPLDPGDAVLIVSADAGG
jgi:molybdopterin converting factor small subunit